MVGGVDFGAGLFFWAATGSTIAQIRIIQKPRRLEREVMELLKDQTGRLTTHQEQMTITVECERSHAHPALRSGFLARLVVREKSFFDICGLAP